METSALKWHLSLSASDVCSLWIQIISRVLRCCFDTVGFNGDFACFVECADRLLEHFFTHAKGGINGGRWAFVIECEESLVLSQFGLDGVDDRLNLRLTKPGRLSDKSILPSSRIR